MEKQHKHAGVKVKIRHERWRSVLLVQSIDVGLVVTEV